MEESLFQASIYGRDEVFGGMTGKKLAQKSFPSLDLWQEGRVLPD